MSTTPLPIGFEIQDEVNVIALEELAVKEGFSFGVLPMLQGSVASSRLLAGPTGKKDKSTNPTFFRKEELLIPGADWSQFAFGSTANWLELDSADIHKRIQSEILLKHEVQWAGYLGLSTLVFPCPSTGPISNFARCLNSMLNIISYTQSLVNSLRPTAMVSNITPYPKKALIRLSMDSGSGSAWDRWNTIRTLSESNPKLMIALELPAELPPDHSLSRWLAEPVKMVIIPTNAFLTNRTGFPVLSKRHQAFVRKMMDLDVNFVVSAPTVVATDSNGGFAAYRQYLQHLHKTRPEPSIIDKFASGYHDYLQSPLQPLMDNLESATYEVFEKDPVKYAQYEQAISLALFDRGPNLASPTVIMVVGAGRGPLVDCALRAAKARNHPVKVYAVEKNPHAIVILNTKKERSWGDKVSVFHGDMRLWQPPEKADILVSELLGSFGDNELSPECLDGAQRLLKADGISIPQSYTTYISPVSSAKLHREVTSFKDETHLETPYVVKFRAVHEIAPSKPIWIFEHPVKEENVYAAEDQFNLHNTRFASTLFEIPEANVLHGIAGYFEATLYKDVMLSILPETHSPGMFSWFPIFFPLKVPIYLEKKSLLEIHFWRLTDSRKVWYEWACVLKGENQDGSVGSSTIHNVGGRSSWIGL
ncbi:Protein arginine N-methyltransferase 5 [Blyttiomyces sp. JEL0837]|nr:Protein arginine N-methyltransferase 5 [Blyttiomyces sp. JEL0837]